jgi:hypothetical protein
MLRNVPFGVSATDPKVKRKFEPKATVKKKEA